MNIRGSDGHSENAWTEEESGTHWLKDLLPEILPKARILAYQYNANAVLRTSAAGVEEQAYNLLHCLNSERRGPQAVRPIIFIAHSMGGILVKEALATAFHDSPLYSILWVFTYGIVFFAVPHKGSKHATWGKMAARMVQLYTGQPNDSFLDNVGEGSNYNVRLSERFSPLLNAFKFFSICETVPSRVGINVGLIVQLDSAILGLPDSQEVRLYPNRTHKTICKFASSLEPEWQQISRILVHGVACATNYTAYSPTMALRQMTEIHSDKMPTDPYSVQQAIHQAQLTLTSGERLLNELRNDEDQIRARVREGISWVWSIFTILGFFTWGLIFYFIPSLLPHAGTIMDNAERGRQSQERLIEFQRQAIGGLDSHRASVLEAIVKLRSPFVHENLPPNAPLLAHEMDSKLSQQIILIISDLERRYSVIPEKIRRLRTIEDVQREGQGMDNLQLLEMVGKRAQEERDILEARKAAAPTEEDRDSCPTCNIQ